MIRLLVLLLTVLTGFSGLVYEVTWQRYLAILLGSHSEATAAVLGLFLGGLALGYSLFGALTRRLVARASAAGRPAPLLVVYGSVEASIGGFALIFPVLFAAVQALSFRIPHGSAGLGFALDVMLSALLVLPPAVLMGGTIPILTQALARSLEDATRFHALVYAFNTAGAFAGALAAGFWLVPSLGLVRVLVWMGGINLAAGAVFLALGALRPQAAEPATAPTPSREASPLRGADWLGFAAVALLVGFAMMTLQTVLIRLGAVSFGSSQFTFSMVVAVFVLCIALGSFAVSALPRIPAFLLPACLWTLLLVLAALYTVADTGPYWAHVLRATYSSEPESFYRYQREAFLGTLLVLAVPVALSGAVLPLMFHALRDRVGDLGEVAGRLYSWNTLGSLLGALIGGYALLFWLDLHQTFRLAIAAIAVAAALMTVQKTSLGRAAPGVLLAATLAGVAMLPAWRPEQLASGLFRERQPLAYTFDGPEAFFEQHPQGTVQTYDDDPVASVAVKRYAFDSEAGNLAIVSNGKVDSSIPGDYVTTSLLALVPALLARDPARSFVVGYGTGVTAGELAALEESREVVVAEISPAVIEAAPQFDFGNLGASQSSKLRIVRGDAYRTLLRSLDKYDVIVSEPSNPWVTGIEMLYSREFLEACRSRLTPGGVHAQWFHSYEVDEETIALVLRTYRSVFPHSAVWFTLATDLLLIGVNDPEAALDLERLASRFQRPDFRAGFARAEIRSLPALLAHEILPIGVLAATALPGEPHTLLHPILSYRSARAFFTGAVSRLPVTSASKPAAIGMRNSLLRRLAAASGGKLGEPERIAAVEETCLTAARQCAPMMASWMADTPESPERERIRIEIARAPMLQSNVGFTMVRHMRWLYDGPLDSVPERVTPSQAEQATRLYAEFYHHAVPFSRDVILRLWQRCEADPKQRDACIAARLELTRTLGEFGI